MSGETRVTVLTPPGTGAIATLEVAGPRAWVLAHQLFRPRGKPLPTLPELHRFWFGTLGEGVGDEVVLAVSALEPEICIEVHCHGGRRIVRWVVEQFTAKGCVETSIDDRSDPWQLITHAPTLRTASILLDQAHGAFEVAVRQILELLPTDPATALEQLRQLVRFAPVGRRLVQPWKVVVAGPPNVGKSSLVNAMAGFQRAVVSEVAGTTRDLVTVRVAFDGWPVELTDVAGLRDAEGLEAEGIDRARRVLGESDLVTWVLDATDPKPVWPRENDSLKGIVLFVVSKCDRPAAWDLMLAPEALQVSTVTSEGIPGLVATIAHRLVPDTPPPGSAVPFTPRLADLVEAAHTALMGSHVESAIRFLRDCLPPG